MPKSIDQLKQEAINWERRLMERASNAYNEFGVFYSQSQREDFRSIAVTIRDLAARLPAV